MNSPEETGEALFSSSPQLVEQIHRMDDDSRFVILDAKSFPGVVHSVRTEASVRSFSDFDQLYLNSHIELKDHADDAREVLDNLDEAFKIKRIEDTREVDPAFDLMCVTDQTKGDVRTIISGIMGGSRGWHVQSIIEHFRYEGPDSELDFEAVSATIEQHTFALSSLIGFIRGEGEEDDEERDNVPLMLEMPKDYYEEDVEEVIEETLDQFIGIDDTIQQLKDVVSIANAPSQQLRANGIEPIQAVMLYGPSGVGKTAIIHSFAYELGADIIEANLSDMSSSMVGQWAKKLEGFFTDAYASSGRVVIMLDEMDGLINSGNPSVDGNITSVLKRQLVELHRHPHVFVVGATNNIDDIDVAVLADKRFQLKLPIQLPTEDERKQLLRSFTIDPHWQGIDDPDQLFDLMDQADHFDFDSLAQQTEGFSGSDIKEIIQQVNRRRFLDAQKSGANVVGMPTQAEIQTAITQVRRSRPQA